MWKIGSWALIVLALSGCASIPWLGSGSDQYRILFESYTVETEWGYRLAGIYIDSDGDVWRYEQDEPWFPAELRSAVVREEDLLKKYRNAKRVGRIDAVTLGEMTDRIPAAARGIVSGDPMAMERSGGLDVAYLYDSRERRYNQVLLRGSGDWIARNDSREARKLVEWLRAVKVDVGFEE